MQMSLIHDCVSHSIIYLSVFYLQLNIFKDRSVEIVFRFTNNSQSRKEKSDE